MMADYIKIGEPANEAERIGLRLLRDQLPNHYIVLGNFDLRLPSRRNSLEYDAVVIGEYGCFAVEIKGWSGVISGGDRYWVLPWGRRSNPLSLLDKKTKALGQFIRGRMPDLPPDFFCAPALIFPRGNVKFDLPESLLRYIVSPEGIYEAFVDLDLVHERGPGPLRAPEKRRELVEAIVALAEPAKIGVFLSYYDVEEELTAGPDQPYREFIGVHQYLRSRAKVRIKSYVMDSLASEAQRRSEKNRILRDIDALEVLNQNPYVARSYEMQPDYNDQTIFYLISEWVGSRSLRAIMENLANLDDRDALHHRLYYGHHLVEAVAAIHKKAIIHRNLTPEAVHLVEAEDAPVPIKLVDFDFARVADLESIAEALSAIGTHGYRAPELWMEEDYDHSVDIFSVGTILFELFAGEMLLTGPGSLLRLTDTWEKKRDKITDPALREAIGEMIEEDPCARQRGLDRGRQVLSQALEAFESEQEDRP